MMTGKELYSNIKVVRKFAKMYRPELTIIGGVIGEENGVIKCDDYIEAMNKLSDDEFVGNYLTAAINPGAIDIYRESIQNGLQLNKLICVFSTTLQNKIKERISKLES